MTLTNGLFGDFWCSFYKVLLGVNSMLRVIPNCVHLPGQCKHYSLAWRTSLSSSFSVTVFLVFTSLVYRQTIWVVEKWIANVFYGQTVIY